MSGGRLFLDTAFVQALLDRRDQYHARAQAIRPRLDSAIEIWITEALLIEIGNALSVLNRSAASEFIEMCYETTNISVVQVDTALLIRSLQLYQSRLDKTWGLTDCISFVMMREHGLTEALTSDSHFVQAGFRALMLEE
ncbi:MAG: PIN domain-containing protein [Isosphaeraceae bacterium]